MDVVVLGLGYIGLPTAAMLASGGHVVFGVEPDFERLRAIKSGCRHITESDVREFVLHAMKEGRLHVDATPPASADAYIICVPTPTRAHRPDLHYVEDAIDAVAPGLNRGNLIVVESTVPPGTTENVIVRSIVAAGKDPDKLHIVHCPERVIPGAILHELQNNDRVIGGRRPVDAEVARNLYASFCRGKFSLTDCTTAELVKIVENTYRDVNLAFANELALLSESLGADAWEVIRLANQHPRVNVLKPGPGVGGHCIPVDPQFLSNANPFVTELIQTARRINERMPHVVARLVDEVLFPRSSAKVGVLGAAYKADVDDSRESPARSVVELLLERNYTVSIYDPLVSRFEYPLAASIEECALGADVLVLITDHSDFRDLDPLVPASLMRRKVIVDTRGALEAQAWVAAGFDVRTLGVRTHTGMASQPARTA